MTLPVPVDLAGVLRRLAREETREQGELARLEARLRSYEDVERPAYDAWVRTVHGPVVARIAELAAELRARQMLAERVTELVEDAGLHPREALWVLQEAPALQSERRARGPTPDEIAARRRAKVDRKRAERRAAKRQRRSGGAATEDTLAAGGDAGAEAATRQRLVALYRGLARSLHPDSPVAVRALPADRLRAIWAEVQAAYAMRSLERLLALATWLETVATTGVDATVAERGTRRVLSLAERHERLRALRRAARALERRLADAACEPAWEFPGADVRARRKLAQAAGRRLASERETLEAALAAVDGFLDGIGPPRAPRGARRR